MAKKSNKSKKSPMIMIGILSAIIAASVAGIFYLNRSTGEAVSFDHIHGMGYTGDGNSLVIPAHDGLRIYEKGSWRNSENEPNDYMGFSMTNDGFFSSGHPAQGSDLKNPFGVVKSDNFGSKIEPLALYGEIDFHGMAAGYNSKAIYIMNPQPNSVMESAGLYFSTDEAKSWNSSNAENVTGSASAIAVHPENEKMLALGTDKGAFLSTDNGNIFNQASKEPVSALTYTFNEKILVGSMGEKAKLTILDLKSLEPKELPIPSSNEGEFISFIAVNPKDNNVITYSTSENNIYQSNNGGDTWDAIADNGNGIKSE
ncbi:F510_1955 family glycosylhydrolase [Domibacillus robiginosus]|uniref:F510_1955 family glycosylhydrolase n=1 Tax=Domibacillus robiginosus TaxID=1071054 RepID=UPI00067CF795|nr:hypothetical protein [Domibacillus robiginosus]